MKIISAEEAGKNKSLFFVFRLSLLLPILLLAVFYLGETGLADENTTIKPGGIIINELMWMGSSTSDADEWIELKNMTSQEINFKETPISIYKDDKLLIKVENQLLKPGDYFLISNNNKDHLFTNGESILNITPDIIDSSISLSNSAVQYKLYASSNNLGELLDTAGGILMGENKDIKKSMERNSTPGDGTKKENWHTCCDSFNLDDNSTDFATPKHANSNDNSCNNNSSSNDTADDTLKESAYAGKIKINEIYPSPDTKIGEKEFIEVKNISNEDISLQNWSATDEKHLGKSIANAPILRPDEIYTFEGIFSLDQATDTARIFDDKNNLVDSVLYRNGKARCRYADNGTDWYWTSQGTPGTENEFDPEVSAKIKRDKTVNSNVYAYFSAAPNDAVKKLSWQFGDGHGSTLKETKHKFTKAKKYAASLTVTGVCETRTYDFKVNVEKYKAPKIRIMRLSPNPEGSDTENEWIEIQNSSKKKINLKGWSIATGWENLYNHPIREDFIIKAGKIGKLGRDVCAFTLANTKTKIELRDPSGKAVQKIEYDNGKKSIREDALYQKSNGSDWEWSESATSEETRLMSAENSPDTKNSAPEKTPAPMPTISPEDLGKYSPSPTWQKKQDYKIELANLSSKIKTPETLNQNQPRVLGERNLPLQENYYTFTQNIPQKHWAMQFVENFWKKINSRINKFLNLL